jgi:hypothetical protein
MRIQDFDTKEKFEISNEQLAKIKEMAIGELTPQGLLDMFPLFAGSRSKNGRKRLFVYDDEWTKERSELYIKYDVATQDKIKTNEERNSNRVKIDKLTLELNELHAKDAQLMYHEDDVNVVVSELRSEIEKFVGGINIDSWREKKEEKKEDKK